MRRILIAALLGAPLFISSPAVAALAKAEVTATAGEQPGVTSGLTHDQIARSTFDGLVPERVVDSAGVQIAGNSDRNALWWLQLGIGNRWHDNDRRHHHRRWDDDNRWHKNHGWHRNHRHSRGWERHRHRDHRWHRHRGWDDDDRRWRRHRDWDDDDHRWRGRHDWGDDDWDSHGHRDWDDDGWDRDDRHRHRGRHDWDDDRDYRWADGRQHR